MMQKPAPISSESRVGAVIVSYNSAALLPACIASVRGAGITDIVVVDNSSADNSPEVAQQHQVQLIAQANLGFASACNVGAQYLATDYLLFLNPDARLENKAVSVAERYVRERTRVGIVGLCLKDTAGRPEPHSFGKRVTLTSLWQRKLHGASMPTGPVVCDWVSGGALLIRATAFRAVKGFDPGYFLYWEDVDLCARVQQRGWQVVHLPAAVAVHQRGASLGDSRKKTAFYDASADRYFRTHYATWIWLLQRYSRRLYRLFSPRVY